MSILLDEADAYERGMDDDLTFQTVRELAGTAYMAGRSAPPTAVEIEAVAKPHVGSGWKNTNYTDLPCTTPRQEAIWMEYNGITRGD